MNVESFPLWKRIIKGIGNKSWQVRFNQFNDLRYIRSILVYLKGVNIYIFITQYDRVAQLSLLKTSQVKCCMQRYLQRFSQKLPFHPGLHPSSQMPFNLLQPIQFTLHFSAQLFPNQSGGQTKQKYKWLLAN